MLPLDRPSPIPLVRVVPRVRRGILDWRLRIASTVALMLLVVASGQ
jgi:hypothetical protein